MKRTLPGSLLMAALALLSTGCEPRYANFGEELDIVEPIDGEAVSFIRTSVDGTTTLLTLEDPEGGGGQIIFTFVEPTTETTVVTGDYAPIGDDEAEAIFRVIFHYPWEASTPVIGRLGSTREEVEIEEIIGFEVLGDSVVIDVAGATWTFQSLDRVVETIDLSTQEGANQFAQIYNLTLLGNQARIIGFGGTGMTQYISNLGTFVGLIEGQMTVRVASTLNPTATMTYTSFEDIIPMSWEGQIITRSNISGNGPMEGVVDFDYASEIGGPILAGSMDYSNIQVSNGLAGSGYYVFTLPTGAWDIPYTVLADMDMTGWLPPTP